MRTKIYEESDYNVMLKTLEELTQGYDSEGNKVAAYFDVHELMDNFGITMEEAIDIAENNGYNVFRLPGGDNLVNQVVIAHNDLSYGDIVKGEESEIEVDDSVDAEEDMNKRVDNEYLKEEVDASIIGKKVNFRGEECTIKDVIEEDDDVLLILSNGKQLLASICVARGTLTSDDASVNAFLDKFKVEEEPEVEPEQEKEPEKAVDSKDAVIQQALNDAREDWEEYKESSPMFKMVKKARKTGRYDNIPTAYPELYADTYYKEFDRLIHSVESKLAKNYAGIIERTYPGEVDELIFWLRKAVTNIYVISGDATMAITQERVDFFNDRDGTNATISRQNNKIFSSWIADLTQKEDILKDMPIEVLDWKIDKNNGKAFEEDELGLVYNKNNNELGSNAVVLDLLYEYDFKLGKQKTNEELEEGLKGDVRIEYNDLEVELDTEDGLRTKTFHNVSYIADRNDVLEALERITDLDIEDIDERLDYYVEKYYDDLLTVFYDDAVKAQAKDYEENPDVYESCSADVKSLNERLEGWSTEFTNEEDVEEGDEYKITKGDVITHYHLDRGRKPDKIEKDKYKVYFRRYKQLSNGGNYLDRNNWYEYGIGGHYFDSLEKARAKVVEYGKELKEELKEIQVRDNENIEKDAKECPLPLEMIPNEMGINLSNVEKVKWEEQEDGQLKKVEIEFNPADDLEEDIEKHDTLNQKLFDGEELKPEIKEKIEQIAYQFVNELNEDGIRFTLKDIVLLGSNVSYNYTKDSDLDIHLIADSSGLECPDNLYPLLYSAYRSMFNKNYDIKIKGIPAEIYVEMDEPVAKSNGIYSLNNGWLKKPEQRDIPDLDEEAFDKLFDEWEDKYFELMEKDATSEDIENFIEDLYDLRKESIATGGEYGLGNLVFKEFRNLGYLDGLKELRKEKKGKELSLEQLDEDFSEDVCEKIYNATLSNNGGTFDKNTGEDLTGKDELKNAYSVEFKSKDWNKRISEIDKDEFIKALNELQSSEESSIADSIGTWSSTEGKAQASCGLNKIFKDRPEAEKFALEHGQDAVGSFDDEGKYKETIYKKDFNINKK